MFIDFLLCARLCSLCHSLAPEMCEADLSLGGRASVWTRKVAWPSNDCAMSLKPIASLSLGSVSYCVALGESLSSSEP